MKLTRPAVLTASAVAGCAAALVAYSASAPASVAPKTAPVAAVSQAKPKVVFAPCVAPAKLEGGACVTHVTKTKYVALPPRASDTAREAATPTRPASPPSPTASQPTPRPTQSGEHESEHEGHDDEDRDHDGLDH